MSKGDNELCVEASAYRRMAGITRNSSPRTDADWIERLKEIGSDDRDITARIMGDPPSWRSALGRPAR